MDARMWTIIGISAVAGIGLGALIVTRTNWYRIRMYAVSIKKVMDRHDMQKKAEAVQAMGQNPNPNPVLMKKPLRELIAVYQELIADLEKVKVPAKAAELHEHTLALHRESLVLYQKAAIGGFRQKSLQDQQRKIMAMEKTLTQKMEKIYGPLKKPAK